MIKQRGARAPFGRLVRVVAVGVAAVVAAGAVSDVSFAHPVPGDGTGWTRPEVTGYDKAVTGKKVPVKPRGLDRPGKPAPKPKWPRSGSATVSIPSTVTGGRQRLTRAGELPVWVGGGGKSTTVGKVRVALLDRTRAGKAGVNGVLVTVTGVDGTSPRGVTVRLDYSGFADGFGGDYGHRLRLVQLPACALSTPGKTSCRVPTVIGSASNNLAAETLTAKLPATDSSSQTLVLAATAGDSSDKGDYKASSLSASDTWDVGEQTGDFSWSYPMRTPPVPGRLTPTVGLGYSSGSVDGRTSNTNSQPSWVGEGFDLSPGFIERRYKPCADDGAPTDEWGNKPGDECWAYDNATVTWNGKGGELIKAPDGTWRMKNDDGTRFEKFTSSSRGNGDNDGEYWKVTTTDGTRFYFGYNRLPNWASGNPETNSTWTVPVFGNNSGEPCNDSSFATSWCNQAWRWNLDYVVDPHGNAIAYYYNQETNYYGRNLKPSDATKYVRGGWLDRMEYGLRSSDMFAEAPARVAFTDSERCIPDATFDCDPSKISSNPDKWPDVPWDLNCSAGTDCGLNGKGAVAPTFWTRKRLTKVTTQVQDAAGNYRNVESWTFAHRWGDADIDKDLLLDSIVHTGLATSTAVTLPAVTFGYTQLFNRVDKDGDDIPPFIKYRLGSVTDESGGRLDVNYSPTDCTLTDLPTPETNTRRCFPVYWTKPGQENPARDWFHKYVAVQLIQTDRTGGAPDMITNYEYVDTPAWHYDTDDGITKEKYKTWSQWRGYGHVRVKTGGVDEGMLTQRDTLYLRGMDGDRASPSGGTKTVTVTDGEGNTYTDNEQWAGFELKTSVYSQPGGTVLAKTVNAPWSHQTASRTRSWGTTTANLTGTETTRTYTLLGDGTWRETKATNTFENTAGLITKVDDRGDTSTAADNLCTHTTYAQDESAWKLNFTAEVETVSVGCDVTADKTTQLVSDVRNYFDGGAFGAPPTKGAITKTERIATYTSTTVDYKKVASTTYDTYGRATAVTDAAGNTATTAYTDTNGLTTQVKATSPPAVPGDSTTSQVHTTIVDPAFGQPIKKTDPNNLVTNLAYDALGRLLKVWLPNRSSTSVTPNYEYSYHITDGAPVAVGVKELTAQGGQKREAFQLFDGWLRPRQTQVPGPGGGRLISDTFYDCRGNTGKTYDTYYSAGNPSTTLLAPYGPNVETQHAYDYDGLSRVTADRLLVGNGSVQETWRTTYSYTGDRTTVTPPTGGTPATTISDARGRTVELRHYKAATPTGDYLSTRYSYTPAGQLKTVTDTTGANVWRYSYDLRGRKKTQEDPDSGTTTYTYNDLDQLVSSTDANNNTVIHRYDPLGRETETRKDADTGPLLTSRLYDTVKKGQLTSATRYAGGQQYTMMVNSYDSLYRPTGVRYIIPSSEGALAGTYQYGYSYRLDGLLQSQGIPAAGDRTAEGLSYTYDTDNLGRLIKISGFVTNTIYSQTGKLLQLELSNGGPHAWITNNYEYGTQRLSSSRVDRENITGVDRDATYSYDPAGNITGISDVSRDGTDNQCFAYDKLRRLTEAWTQATATCAASGADATVGGPVPYWTSYTYDDTGNRSNETLHGIAGTSTTTRTYTYPTPGQARPHFLTSV